jgi:hypothetical protein
MHHDEIEGEGVGGPNPPHTDAVNMPLKVIKIGMHIIVVGKSGGIAGF